MDTGIVILIAIAGVVFLMLGVRSISIGKWLRTETGIIQWTEVESSSSITSAAATIQQGFNQYYSDVLTVQAWFVEHVSECPICEKEKGCSTAEKVFKEVENRFSRYEDFFKVIESLEKMIDWVGVVRE